LPTGDTFSFRRGKIGSRAAGRNAAQRKRDTVRAFVRGHADAYNKGQREKYARRKALAEEALAARAAKQPARMGAPRKDDIRELVQKLRSDGKSLEQTRIAVNREKGLNLSIGAIRGYAKKSIALFDMLKSQNTFQQIDPVDAG
jgi:hypothetical protein